MTILKGGVDGFNYFSLISVILFSNQDHPCMCEYELLAYVSFSVFQQGDIVAILKIMGALLFHV